MANTSSIAELRNQFEVIRSEQRTSANTAERVGNALLGIIPFLEDLYGQIDGVSQIAALSQQQADARYVTIPFFNRLFTIHGQTTSLVEEVVDGETVQNTVTQAVTVLPNDVATPLTDIETNYGLWTHHYLSALGQNASGSGSSGSGPGGGSVTLAEPLQSINNEDLGLPEGSGQWVLVYDQQSESWGYERYVGSNSGIDETALWNKLGANTNEQINSSHLSTFASGLFTSLVNDGNNISMTIGGVTKTLTVGYASVAGGLSSAAYNSLVTSIVNMMDGRYVSVSFFNRLFRAYNGSSLVTTNDPITTIDSIKAMVGLWTEQYLSALGQNASGSGSGSGGGSVMSVGLSMPQGFTVTGSPVTESGTITVSLSNGYVLPTSGSVSNWNSVYQWFTDSANSSLINSKNADTVDGYHASGLFTSLTNTGDYLSMTIGGTTRTVIPAAANKLRITGYGTYGLTFDQGENILSVDGWSHFLIANHGNGATYYNYMIGLPFNGTPIYRRMIDGVVSPWYHFITNENWSTYITNVASADRLSGASSYTAWGQTYWQNGVPNSVSGDMTVNGHVTKVKDLTPYTANYYSLGYAGNAWQQVFSNYLFSGQNNALNLGIAGTSYMTVATSGYVGIGTQSPAYKLDVSGYMRTTLRIYSDAGANGGFSGTTDGGNHDAYYGVFSATGGNLPVGALGIVHRGAYPASMGLGYQDNSDGHSGYYFYFSTGGTRTTEGTTRVRIRLGEPAIEIGNGCICWVEAENAIKVMHRNGNAANLYATGAVSALGLGSNGGSGSSGSGSSGSTGGTGTSGSANNEVHYKLQVQNGSGGSRVGMYWHCLGHFTTQGPSSMIIIDVYSGNGFNGYPSQNSWAHIVIKDGYDNSNNFGVTCERHGSISRDANDVVVESQSLQVAVVSDTGSAYAANVAKGGYVWVYLPWDYPAGEYFVKGSYETWENNDVTGNSYTSDAASIVHDGIAVEYINIK